MTWTDPAATVPMPKLRGMSTVALDPACPGDRHGSHRAYREYGCRCPDVLAYVAAYNARRRARVAERLASLPPDQLPRGRFDVDDGDVEAAVVRALRWKPLPAGLTTMERRLVALRLHHGHHLSADAIAVRTGLSDRQVQRYLSGAVLADIGLATATGVGRNASRSTVAGPADVYAAA